MSRLINPAVWLLATLVLFAPIGRRARVPVRSRRVRPFAPPVPFTESSPAYEVPPRAAMVRPYVRDAGHCARRREARAHEARRPDGPQRRGSDVLLEVVPADPMWRCPAPGCLFAAVNPVPHLCPLTGANVGEPAVEMAR